MKISVTKARKLRDALKKLHEDTVGCGQESSSYFAVSLQNQQQVRFFVSNRQTKLSSFNFVRAQLRICGFLVHRPFSLQETSSLTNAPVPHFLESVTKYILENHATQVFENQSVLLDPFYPLLRSCVLCCSHV